MRLSTATTLLFTLALAALSHAAILNLPTLYSCEPATIRVLAQGNYTLEGRDLDSHKLFFRVRVDKATRSVNWDAVDLPANSTAVITVTDQLSAGQTSTGSVQGLVLPNPTGNTTCLAARRDRDRKSSQKNMVPTIVGIVLGAFFLLVLLLVAGMMYRRRKEKSQKIEEDSVDLNHGGYAGKPPAGGSYMARLVPGLKFQEARPLPRDPRLESEQATYASTRRGTQYYNNAAGLPPAANYELPNYNQSQRLSRTQPPYPQQWPQQPQPPSPTASTNPFSSQPNLPSCYDLPHERPVYAQPDYQRSQTSFLSKKASQ